MIIHDEVHVAEQHSAYRKGMVLGLTMAEVGILIIFVLLLLIGFIFIEDEKEAKKLENKEIIDKVELARFKAASARMSSLSQGLGVPEDEITRLVKSMLATDSLHRLEAAVAAYHEANDHLERTIAKITSADSSALSDRIADMSFTISNQQGLLDRYEEQLEEAGLGTGARPCWVDSSGNIDYLYEVVLQHKGIRMREVNNPDRSDERKLLPLPVVDPNEILTQSEFAKRTLPLFLYSIDHECRFFVIVYDGTGPTEKERYKSLLKTVEGHFYKRLDDGRPPF